MTKITKMKSIKYFVVAMTMAVSFSGFAAAIPNSAGHKLGTVSVSGAPTVDSLSAQLQEKAKKAGASSIRIVSAGGNNKMFGVAEIYN